MHLRILPDHQNQVLKKIILMYGLVINVFLRICIFNVKSGKKRVLVHLRILQEHHNQFLKKIFFNVWSGYKRVFTHLRILPNNQNQVLKKDIF
jgi:hypothetical protein